MNHCNSGVGVAPCKLRMTSTQRGFGLLQTLGCSGGMLPRDPDSRNRSFGGPVNEDAGTAAPADFAPRKTHPGRLELFEGRIEGHIIHEPRGAAGFGYDPVFYVPHLDRTLAELTPEVKNQISHRAHALQAVRAALERRLG